MGDGGGCSLLSLSLSFLSTGLVRKEALLILDTFDLSVKIIDCEHMLGVAFLLLHGWNM